MNAIHYLKHKILRRPLPKNWTWYNHPKAFAATLGALTLGAAGGWAYGTSNRKKQQLLKYKLGLIGSNDIYPKSLEDSE